MLTLVRNILPEDLYHISARSSSHDVIFEDFNAHSHLDGFIEKPWGHEYRIFRDDFYDIWKLYLSPGEATSSHCHIQKDTVLICMSGGGYMSFADDSTIELEPGRRVYIPKGVFHQSIAGSFGLDLIEIENPRNKLDLLRLKDRYGRQLMQYEKRATLIDNLPRMLPVGPKGMLRKSDLFHHFLFETAKLNEKLIEDNQYSLFVIIDVSQHVYGKIVAFSGVDEELRKYLNLTCLIITTKVKLQ